MGPMWKVDGRLERGRRLAGCHVAACTQMAGPGVAELRSQTGDEVTVTMEGGLMRLGDGNGKCQVMTN